LTRVCEQAGQFIVVAALWWKRVLREGKRPDNFATPSRVGDGALVFFGAGAWAARGEQGDGKNGVTRP
jgi:hypothetical protein